MQEQFGLQYELLETSANVNAAGSKTNYYSLNKSVSDLGYAPKYTSLECIILNLVKLKNERF